MFHETGSISCQPGGIPCTGGAAYVIMMHDAPGRLASHHGWGDGDAVSGLIGGGPVAGLGEDGGPVAGLSGGGLL